MARQRHEKLLMGKTMMRGFLKAKIHGATVTEANLNYEGSITIDASLMEASNILPFEMVDLYSISSGERLTTYAIPGAPDSGVICVNGAAAHKIKKGERIIICCYGYLSPEEIATHQPRVYHVNAHNQIE